MSFSLRFAFKRSDSLMREFLDVDLLLLQSHPHRIDETGSDRRGGFTKLYALSCPETRAGVRAPRP